MNCLMKNEIIPTNNFLKDYKKLKKKYKRLPDELKVLKKTLLNEPKIGIYLGNNTYKIRLANKDKNKGKSAGFRVITYIINKTENSVVINLITIYDKSDIKNIPNKILLKMIETLSPK